MQFARLIIFRQICRIENERTRFKTRATCISTVKKTFCSWFFHFAYTYLFHGGNRLVYTLIQNKSTENCLNSKETFAFHVHMSRQFHPSTPMDGKYSSQMDTKVFLRSQIAASFKLVSKKKFSRVPKNFRNLSLDYDL